MKNSTVIAASIAALAASASSLGATWGGFSIAIGMPRVVASVNQASSGAVNATSFLAVNRCSGVMEYPVFVAAGATCVATTPDYQITMTVLSATQTEVAIIATSPACDLKAITFGTPNSSCGYDVALPNPGTVGSLAGFNPTQVAGSLFGAWTSYVVLDNRVNVGGIAPVGDLYSRMTVYFSSCFDVGDAIKFRVDTDKIN
jgi:hypothetical protein